jgi:hypothetical protein
VPLLSLGHPLSLEVILPPPTLMQRLGFGELPKPLALRAELSPFDRNLQHVRAFHGDF